MGAPSSAGSRVASIDLIRGAVMILMAIDHVRVYSGLPAGGPTAGIFFTRWVTHFCAPAFIFLAGTSYFLAVRRYDGTAVGRYGATPVPTAVPPYRLFFRGAWLILLELTVIRFAWTFNFDYANYALAGVIWVIGWSMILLAPLSRLPLRWIAAFGIAMIALHNAVGPVVGRWVEGLGSPTALDLWKVVYLGFFQGPIELGFTNLMVLYSIVPWVGVMAAGYAFGHILTLEPARRDRACLQIGLGATALFLVLRFTNLYGDPRAWDSAQGLLGFLNTSKYPASLSFLLMTLGPTIALIPWLERARGRLAQAISVFGRVPFFYYMLHIPLIHVLALLVSRIRLGAVSPWLFTNHPMMNPPPPDGYVWSLGLLYLVFAIAIAVLYPACRWFASFKARRSDWWVRYL